MTFDPQAELLQALVSHGLPARKEEGWIALEGHAPLLRAFALEHSRESGVGVRAAAKFDRSPKCDLRPVRVALNRIKEKPERFKRLWGFRCKV